MSSKSLLLIIGLLTIFAFTAQTIKLSHKESNQASLSNMQRHFADEEEEEDTSMT